MTRSEREFRDAMRLMRWHDPQAREDGFVMLRPFAREHLEDLMAEFVGEKDQGCAAGCSN